MNRIEQVFGESPVLLPVVHPIGRKEAMRSIAVVERAGAKGVFLIDQGMTEREVLALVLEARAAFPDLWIGVNLLGRRAADALALAMDACAGRIDGIWSDNAGIDERATPQPAAEAFVTARHERSWNGLYFGGVAFKYQREIAFADLGRTAGLAARYMDVLCTSGPGTGKAADPDKVRAIHDGAGGAAIALASGVTADNADAYTPYVDAFLVGTSIEATLGVIDETKLAALLAALHESA
jgi:predicted TIM-barrel enzyme